MRGQIFVNIEDSQEKMLQAMMVIAKAQKMTQTITISMDKVINILI